MSKKKYTEEMFKVDLGFLIGVVWGLSQKKEGDFINKEQFELFTNYCYKNIFNSKAHKKT